MKKIKEFLKEPFLWGVIIPVIIMSILPISISIYNQNTLVKLRENQGMIFIEKGLVYHRSTGVLYQEIPSYGRYYINNSFYVPFYDENGKVILFNN